MKMRGPLTCQLKLPLVVITCLLLFACSTPNEVPRDVTTPSGLQYIDLLVGTGVLPKPGQIVVVDYTIWLHEGTKVDSSLDRGVPFRFRIGRGMVIAGFDEGIASMRVGGKRRLIIPPDLAYGDRGAGGVIPPYAQLTCDVELLAVE